MRDLTYYTLKKISVEIESRTYIGKEIFDSFKQANRRYTAEKLIEQIDVDFYMKNTINFSHQAVLVSKFYSNNKTFKLSELGSEIVAEELNNMIEVIVDIIICTKELGNYNSTYLSIINNLEDNIKTVAKRILTPHEPIGLVK